MRGKKGLSLFPSLQGKVVGNLNDDQGNRLRSVSNLDQGSRFDEAVPALFHYLGGVEKISAAHQMVAPEFFEINITWPVKSSDEQEGGFLPLSVIDDLSSMRCTLTFAFL